MGLYNEIKKLKRSKISLVVNKRLNEFSSFGKKNNEEWFSELCFCILTANSKAKTALSIQEELAAEGFLCYPKERISSCIKRNKHRFHNNKARYIVEARKFKDIKDLLLMEIKGSRDPRDFLVKNVKGLGMKEASHFLRNVGFKDYAIVDRHIVNVMSEYGLIKKPEVISKKIYIKIEDKFKQIASKVNMDLAELDLYMWYMKTNEILK